MTVGCTSTRGMLRTQVLQEAFTMLSRNKQKKKKKREKIAMEVEKCKFKVKT